MSLELADANVVVIARAFNPAVFGEHWLVRNELIREGDLQEGFVFTDVFSQFQTRDFAMSVVQQRLQFAPKVPEARQQNLIIEKVGAVIRLLPHTPYTAAGLNLTW